MDKKEKKLLGIFICLVSSTMIFTTNASSDSHCLTQIEMKNLCYDYIKRCKENPKGCIINDLRISTPKELPKQKLKILSPGTYSVHMEINFKRKLSSVFVVNTSPDECISGYQYDTELTRSNYTESNRIEIRYCNNDNTIINKLSDICVANTNISCNADDILSCNGIDKIKCI